MKKLSYMLIGILLTIVGCNDEDRMVNQVAEDVIQASLEEGNPISRMAIDGDNAMTWEKREKFKLFTADGQSSVWTLKDECIGTTTGSFTGQLQEGELMGAVYPDCEQQSLSPSGLLTVTLPAQINFSEDHVNPPMWATLTNLGEVLSFKHLGALLKIDVSQIPEGYKKMKIQSQPAISGEFVYDINSELTSTNALRPVSDAEGTLIVSFPGQPKNEGDDDLRFYLPLPVGTYQTFTISLLGEGEDELLLNDWKNVKVYRKRVYYTSLSAKIIEASTTTEFNNQTSEKEEDAVINVNTYALTGQIDTSKGESNEPLVVPPVTETTSDVNIIFSNTPKTTEEKPLIIVENTDSESVSEGLMLAVPVSDTEKLEHLVVETPNTTVTAKEGTYGTVTATTATNTFIVSQDAVIDHLIVKAGNVIVRGKVKNITRHADNKENFYVMLEGGSVDNKEAGIVVSDVSWYNATQTMFTIRKPEELIGFIHLLYKGETFQNKIIRLGNDLDMRDYKLYVPGMIYGSPNYVAFNGTLDGQGHCIQNLTMNYVRSKDNDVSVKNHVMVGLIPVADRATILDLTLDGGSLLVIDETTDTDKLYVGALVGSAGASLIENCHNQGVKVTSLAKGCTGGLVGYAGYVYYDTDNHTYLKGCSNSGTIQSVYTGENDYTYVGGLVGEGWGESSYIVGCYNRGIVMNSNSHDSSRTGGLVGQFGGSNYMYGCFNLGNVTGATSGDLVGETSYSTYFYNSCYTGTTFAGYSVGDANLFSVCQTTYDKAVFILNQGVVAFNKEMPVPCYYRFVDGTKPAFKVVKGEEEDVLIADKSWYNDSQMGFKIGTREEFLGFIEMLYEGNNFQNKFIELQNDVSFHGYTLKIPGMIYNGEGYTTFNGSLNGNGYRIQHLNLQYKRSANNNLYESNKVLVGLIPATSGYATIQNLTLEGGGLYVNDVTSDTDKLYVGALVGNAANAAIINCHNEGFQVTNENLGCVGGLVGYAGYLYNDSGYHTYVLGCSNTGSVQSTYTTEGQSVYAGGLVGEGWGESTYVVASYNAGHVTNSSPDTYSRTGGLVGQFGGTNYMYGCYNQGKVTGASSGELVGETSYAACFYNSCYTGSAFAGYSVGDAKKEELRQFDYEKAVVVMNTGIELYCNIVGVRPCHYRFIAGTKPVLKSLGDIGSSGTTGTPGLGEGSSFE